MDSSRKFDPAARAAETARSRQDEACLRMRVDSSLTTLNCTLKDIDHFAGRLAVPMDARVPAHVKKLLLRALCFEPKDRFASMDALLEALAFDPRAR